MVTPRVEEIEEKAKEIFFESNPSVMATPEIDELKETGYWERARRELMTGVASAEIGEKERQKQGVIEALEDASVMTTIRTLEKNVETLKSKLSKPIMKKTSPTTILPDGSAYFTATIETPKKKRRVSLKTLRALKKARKALHKKRSVKKPIKKRKEVRKKMPSGWRINGKRVYSVKGKTKTKKKTYRTKASALRHSHRRKK